MQTPSTSKSNLSTCVFGPGSSPGAGDQGPKFGVLEVLLK